MGKGKRNKINRTEEYHKNITIDEIKKGEKKMLWIPIVISILSLCISCYTAYLQWNYSDADYKYKRNPEFKIGAQMAIRLVPQGETHIAIPTITGFDVEIISENNIEKLYFISPANEVREIRINDNVEDQVRKYFEQEYELGEPDLVTENGHTSYFYRFMIYTGINDQMEIKMLYAKTENLTSEEIKPAQIDFVDEVRMLEFEKAHLDDPHYEGERQIAAEYRELEKHFEKYL